MRKTGSVIFGIAIYTLSAVAYIYEFAMEVTGFEPIMIPWEWHEVLMIMILLGFLTGFVVIWKAYLVLRHRNQAVEQQLSLAKDAFGKELDKRMASWGLSEAETEVARLTIKGMSLDEIARLRQTQVGTIKTQSSSIYKKAGVRTRSQLSSLIIEELLNA